MYFSYRKFKDQSKIADALIEWDNSTRKSLKRLNIGDDSVKKFHLVRNNIHTFIYVQKSSEIWVNRTLTKPNFSLRTIFKVPENFLINYR